MKTTGIIAEYNPFHNGHLYQMQEARRLSGADYIIVVMSPDFVQRGAPALTDKWARAHMALQAGADLVLELPIRAATGSAEYFAMGGVSLLSSLHVVDALSFGCETADITPLAEYASFLTREEPGEYRQLLQRALKEGKSFAQARCDAYLEYRRTHTDSDCGNDSDLPGEMTGGISRIIPASGKDTPALDKASLGDLLRSPNNILAVEYLKAILKTGSRLKPVPVRRTGAGYHDPAFDSSKSGFASATGIRTALSEGIDIKDQIPDEAYEILYRELTADRYLTTTDLDLPLHLKLIASRQSLAAYSDVSEELANRIDHLLGQYTGFEQFTDLLKTKQIARTRVTRALLHILLGLKKEADTDAARDTRPGYARVLGFRRSAQPLLAKIKERSDLTLITKLPPESQIPIQLQEDLNASQLWEILVSHKAHVPVRNERQRQILRISSSRAYHL